MRALLAVSLCLALGCEDDDGPTYQIPSAGDGGAIDGSLLDARASEPDAQVCTLGGSYSYGLYGGLLPRRYRTQLREPSTYVRELVSAGDAGVTCSVALPACGSASLDVADLLPALSAPEVAAALAGGATEYGFNRTPVDGEVFTIERAGGGTLTIGDPCDTSPSGDCRAIPESVAALRRLLRSLDTQQIDGGPCPDAPR